MTEFEKWWKKEGSMECYSCEENAEEAWNYQQGKMDKLSKSLGRDRVASILDAELDRMDLTTSQCLDNALGEIYKEMGVKL